VGSQKVMSDEASFCNDIYYVNVGALQLPNKLMYYLYQEKILMGPNYNQLNATHAEQIIIFALTSR
jgi:hypothetical protein